MFEFVKIYCCWFQTSLGYFLHLRVDHGVEIYFIVLGICAVCESINVTLELVVGYFIAWLVFAVLLAVLLNGIIGEVDHWVIKLLKVEDGAGGTDVTILVPVPFDLAVDGSYQHISSNVEFTIVVEERSGNVLLNDEGSFVYLVFGVLVGKSIGFDLVQLTCRWY